MSRPYGSKKNKIISYIASHPRCSSLDIANAFNMTHKQAGTFLWSYERKGFVVKERSGAGGRGSHHFLYSIPPVDIPKNREELEARKNASLVKPSALVEDELLSPSPIVAVPAPEKYTELGDILTGVVDTLAHALTKQIVERLEPMLAERLQALVSKAVDPTEFKKDIAVSAPTLSSYAEQKRKLCVVGLLPNQIQLIDREFKECFDLRFVKSDESIHQLRHTAKQCDLTILMTGFINHAMTDALKKENIERMDYVMGGLTALRNKLTDIYLATAQ